mgnify:CR=1 FL=1
MPAAQRGRSGVPSHIEPRTYTPAVPMVLVYILGALTVLGVFAAAVVAVGLEGKE